MEAETPLRRGWVEPALRAEFSGLALVLAEVDGAVAAQPAGREGAPASTSRTSPTGRGRWPSAASRSRRPTASSSARSASTPRTSGRRPRPRCSSGCGPGRFKSRNTLDDGLTVAIVETGVPVRAFDADRIQGDLGLRVSQPRENASAGTGSSCREGTIVIADERHAIGAGVRRHRPGRGVSPETRRMLLCAVQVPGRPGHQRRGSPVDLQRHPDELLTTRRQALAGRQARW